MRGVDLRETSNGAAVLPPGSEAGVVPVSRALIAEQNSLLPPAAAKLRVSSMSNAGLIKGVDQQAPLPELRHPPSSAGNP